MSLPTFGPSVPHVFPLYTAASYEFADLDAIEEVYAGQSGGYIYARDAHPNAGLLANELNTREHAQWGYMTGSGMAAITAGILGVVKAGDHVLYSNRLYGRTTQLIQQQLHRFGVTSASVDCNDLDGLAAALETKPKLLMVETISNPMLRVIDHLAVSRLCRYAGTKLFVDNTFATPLLCRPLEIGADLVMESVTKIINGHGDVTLGYIGGTDPELGKQVNAIISIWGFSASPFDCWQASRSLSTFELRMHASSQNAKALAESLIIDDVLINAIHPNLHHHPDREYADVHFPAGAGHMLGIELVGGRSAVNSFMRAVPELTFTPSLGDVHTTLSHPDSTSHRYESTETKLAQGITPGLIRVSVGIEPIVELQNLFHKGLSAVRQMMATIR